MPTPNTDLQKQIFPKDFYWGASTASHQVEGGTINQWSEWELANASELAKTAQQRLGYLPNWESIKTQATNPSNYVSGKGVDHYKRYKEDFDIIQKLNLNAFRFGIEWSRIEPEEGVWDEEALQHYHDYIDELVQRNIEPFLNIWHWTMPTWFTKKGGFAKRKNLVYWRRFVQKISKEFGDKLGHIITINEPNVYTTFSYLTGEWVPEGKNPITFLRVYLNLATAHKQAYRILKRAHPKLQIGLAPAMANIQAKRPHSIVDEISTWWMRYFWNWWFVNRVRRHQDFVGFNHYFSDYYRGLKTDNPDAPKNDLGWYMEPEGIYPLLVRTWAHYKKPIIITENGVADADDQYRQWWIEQTIIAMERALSEGIELKGYLHWSLLDNFEWKYGWWAKFGLIHVDREHGMKRTARPSAIYYANTIKQIQAGESLPKR